MTGRAGITLTADVLLNDIEDALAFMGVVIPGGDMTFANTLRGDERVLALLEVFNRQQRLCCGMGEGSLVLKEAGVLYGRKYAAPPHLKGELPNCTADVAVRVDEHVLTCQGGGTSLECSLAIVELYRGQEFALRTARYMRYPRLESEEIQLLAPVYDEQLGRNATEVPRETFGVLGGRLEVDEPHPESVAPPPANPRGLLGWEVRLAPPPLDRGSLDP